MALSWTDILAANIPIKIKKVHINEIRTYLDNHIDLASGHPMASHTTAGFMSAAHWDTVQNFINTGNGIMGIGVTAPITSTGTDAPTIGISPATTISPGSFAATDKAKLDTYPDNYSTVVSAINAKGTVTNITSPTPAISISNPTSTPAISIADATTSQSGLLSASDKVKINTMDGFPIGTIIMWHDASGVFGTLFDGSGNGKGAFEKWAICWGGVSGNRSPIDMREVFPLGASHNTDAKRKDGTNTFVLNGVDTTGEQAHTLTMDESAAHTHPYKDVFYSEILGGKPAESTYTNIPSGVGSNSTDHDNVGYELDRTTSSVGGNKAHNNMPPFIRVYFLYKHTA